MSKQLSLDKKWAIFRKQRGLCIYCHKPMRIVGQLKRRERTPDDAATFEHLDDKYSPDRGKRYGEYRVVLACNACNNKRSAERTAALSKAELWERSGRRPREVSA